MTETSLLQLPPLSLYVHIPWCVRKCPYCDFNSHETGDEPDQAAYVSALMLDLEHELAFVSQREIQSIFIGGGTPSLFSAEHIDRIISGVRKRIPVAADAEITLEANPGTFEQQRFSDYRASGINRLSIGIQSFDNDKLERLGRIHDRDEAIKAIETADAAGFDNVNLDLMFGLPQQSVEQAVADAELACEFDPAHLSHYQLTIEANTFFHKHRPVLPSTDTLWEMQQRCHDVIGQHGYTHYEVSAFSRTGKQCLHNLNYWQFGDYIGIGAGAHGKITDISRQTIQRRWKHRQPAAYLSGTLQDESCSGTSELDRADLMFEFLLNALRLRQGFDFELFEQRTGIDRTRLLEACNNIDPALLTLSDSGLSTSQRGFDFLNDVLYGFLPEQR
ncbi:MAG: radical SAM family heme chaperone HemW [Thiotrichales bacterium]|nr:MAG: radical SAM family heme chaperone HemW [Thiotrichales bacterium]